MGRAGPSGQDAEPCTNALLGFYRDLLRWLFVDSGGEPPEHGRIRVELE